MKENSHMQSWAKRGLQTALVTGGLLMLGTGIASADENVNPDTPASPLDLNVTVPIDIGGNAVGTPFGQLDVPSVKTELSTKPVTKQANAALGELNKNVSPVSPSKIGDGAFSPTDAGLKGNKVAGDVVAPIQISCNAIGAIGDASVTDCSSEQSWSHNQDVATDGKNSGIAGNAVVLDWAAPIQIAGNAGGVLGGSGRATGSASQSATETGNVSTNGKGSGLSGNVVAGQFATPVQVSGNAASYILGNAYSEFNADSAATSGGWIKTNGAGGAGTGNVAGVPIALPVKFNCNAAGAWGSDADTGNCNTSADAKAGDKRPGAIGGIPTYIETGGNESFLGGNVAAPQGGLIANVAGVAASWIGNAGTGGGSSSSAVASEKADTSRGSTGGSSSSTVDSGGFISTDAKKSGGSGNVIDPAVALPVEAFGIGGTYIGNSHANHDNATDANAGNGSYTDGTDGVLGGNIVNTQDALTAEVFGVGGSHIGNATGTATETKTVTAGGYDGTQGNNSSGSGNIVQVPTAIPAEVFGIGGSFIGQGSGSADEVKVVHGGGGGNTQDDNGAVSSNLATAPLSVPVQLFGLGGSFIGQGHGKASSDTTSIAGGDVHATGPLGAIAGNLIQAPVSLPVQGHGTGAAVAGIGTGASDNLTDSTAGGNAVTDGHDGGVAGNIVQAPFAGAATIFGDGAVLGGLGHGTSTNDIMSTAGGDSTTNGDRGGVAGNIIGVDGLPIAQIFGDAVSAGGVTSGDATNTTVATTGGDLTTSGVEGGFSGDILDVPVTAVAQVFGDAVAVVGSANAAADNQTTGTSSGGVSTNGDQASLSGVELQEPIGALVQLYGVALDLFGHASAVATNDTALSPEALIDLPMDMSEMGANEVPSLPVLSDLPTTMPAYTAQRADLPQAGGLPTLPVTVPSLTALPIVSSLPVQLPTQLPTLSALPTQLPTMSTMPALPTQLPTLPSASSLPIVGGVTGTPQVQVPALAQMDNGPLGMFSKLFAGLTGKPFHTR
jgi:hypothetical protein